MFRVRIIDNDNQITERRDDYLPAAIVSAVEDSGTITFRSFLVSVIAIGIGDCESLTDDDKTRLKDFLRKTDVPTNASLAVWHALGRQDIEPTESK